MWWEQRAVADADRLQWAWIPLEGLGPLRFGTSRDEVIDVLGATRVSTGEDQEHRWADFESLGIRTYYDRYEDEGLMAVISDGLCGPRVRYNGTAFTGRPPSELNRWIEEIAHVHECYTSSTGNPTSLLSAWSCGLRQMATTTSAGPSSPTRRGSNAHTRKSSSHRPGRE